MNVVEAVILIVVFATAVYLATTNFLTTAQGYISLIESRYKILEGAAGAQSVYFKPSNITLLKVKGQELLITPYYMKCTDLDIMYFRASGYPALLINATYLNYPKGYYFLVPSPSYQIPQDTAKSAHPLPCRDPQALVSQPATSFIVLPNGTVKATPISKP